MFSFYSVTASRLDERSGWTSSVLMSRVSFGATEGIMLRHYERRFGFAFHVSGPWKMLRSSDCWRIPLSETTRVWEPGGRNVLRWNWRYWYLPFPSLPCLTEALICGFGEGLGILSAASSTFCVLELLVWEPLLLFVEFGESDSLELRPRI
jgi:hypothetical protein